MYSVLYHNFRNIFLLIVDISEFLLSMEGSGDENKPILKYKKGSNF